MAAWWNSRAGSAAERAAFDAMTPAERLAAMWFCSRMLTHGFTGAGGVA